MKNGFTHTVVCFLLVFIASAAADIESNFLGDTSDGSRAVPVHLINLIDEEGQKILREDDVLLPFSTRNTCGACHNYEKIVAGWHFNAGASNVAPGRPGQPWILVDAATATQIPLSYRPWPGTYRPEQLGITAWQFVKLFGRHMPGGGVGELDSDKPEEIMRQFVSGKVEINCLACHNADPAHDQAEYAGQITRQNFRWAATGSCGFASVSGSAKTMPDTYDYLMPDIPDDPKQRPPMIDYRIDTFDHKNRVFFEITQKPLTQRCYFCHSNADVEPKDSEKWAVDKDVHIAAGLSCVDCHRNGLDHNITRGYEREESASANPLAVAFSCADCHTQGRLGAPTPSHPGIPPIHFEKLTCTACHSGPWPAEKTVRTKTSRAHGLGTHNVNKSPDALPHITYPVFARQAGIGAGYAGALLVLSSDGKIAPHKLVWPAFWAALKDKKVEPIALDTVKPIAAKIIGANGQTRTGDWPNLTEEQIAEVLTSLKTIEGRPVYICGGKLYKLDDSGKLFEQEHSAAQPYLWPIAHDVRPAAQSLGVRGCKDCHSVDEGFFFGQVAVDSPIAADRDLVRPMVEFQQLDPLYTRAFAFSFVFRPWLKVVALASCAVLAAVLLLYGLKALACITKFMVGKD